MHVIYAEGDQTAVVTFFLMFGVMVGRLRRLVKRYVYETHSATIGVPLHLRRQGMVRRVGVALIHPHV